MTSADERMAALRIALLHPADRRWMLRQLPSTHAARLRTLMSHPAIRQAVLAGITADEITQPRTDVAVETPSSQAAALDEHAHGWDAEWASLLREGSTLPPALAASLSEYRTRTAQEAA